MTKIPWCNETWNVTFGCQKVSSGCKNCYAERMAKRLQAAGMVYYRYAVDENGWTGRVTPAPQEVLNKPLRWKEPRLVFVDSMSDLFARDQGIERLPMNFYIEVFSIISATPQHVYLILTKRPDLAMGIMNTVSKGFRLTWPFPNVWMGVTTENWDEAAVRIPKLLKIEAEHYFVSAEPLLGALDLRPWLEDLDWVIAGSESGPKRRPALKNWFTTLRDDCYKMKVPFFLKQMEIDGKTVKLPELDGVVWNQIP